MSKDMEEKSTLEHSSKEEEEVKDISSEIGLDQLHVNPPKRNKSTTIQQQCKNEKEEYAIKGCKQESNQDVERGYQMNHGGAGKSDRGTTHFVGCGSGEGDQCIEENITRILEIFFRIMLGLVSNACDDLATWIQSNMCVRTRSIRQTLIQEASSTRNSQREGRQKNIIHFAISGLILRHLSPREGK